MMASRAMITAVAIGSRKLMAKRSTATVMLVWALLVLVVWMLPG
jgi:hypothetical protein